MSNFLDFNINFDTFLEDLRGIIKNSETKTKELLKIKQKTYANFVKELEAISINIDNLFTPLSHLNSVKNTKATQDIYAKSLEILTLYSTKISQNLNIYKAYKEILLNEKTLNNEQKRVLELYIVDFELSGANLDLKSKKELKKINLKKSSLSNKFSQNVLDATNSYNYVIEDEKDMQNLSQSDIESARFVDSDGKTKYKITLHYPSYIAYMSYGKNRAIREELYRAYTSKAPQNAKIIDKLLLLRQELSKILGFKNYASYSLKTKMAKDDKEVLNFLNLLLNRSKKQAKIEFRELKKVAKHKLESYDIAFYSEVLKKLKHDIDEEEYRAYFEQKSVVDGLITFLNQLFEVEFKKVNIELWDEKAFAYDLFVDKKLKARLYLDLESREGKKGGAWMDSFTTHHKTKDGKTILASAVIVCNFPPSTKENPSLLRHDDVVTLFHEMGHTLHHLLSEVSESSISGVNGVEWDAVEFPSQFLENFAYEKEVLKLFAKHYKSGEVLSDEMIQRLVDAKNFQSALVMLRQLEFGLFDFILHSRLYQKDEVQTLLDAIRAKTTLIKPPAYNKFQNSFTHIFAGGYAAGYYSYKYSEVLSADVFYRVVDENIFNSKTAKKYLKIILQGGASKSMDKLFYELMDSKPNIDNLLRLSGIK